jgi:hypothetical protein
MDGGYIVLGNTSHNDPSDYQPWLIKTDARGNEVWDRTFGGPASTVYEVQQTSDGGYIITTDMRLIKTDENGIRQWDRTFEGSCRSGQQTSDGGYIICGRIFDLELNAADVWLMKTDSEGNHQWDRTFGGEKWDWASSVQQTRDGGYVMTGDADCIPGINGDLWVIKTDSSGFVERDEKLGTRGGESGRSIRQTEDGGYIVTGVYGKGDQSFEIWLIKLGGASCTTYYRDADGDLYGDASDSLCLESPSYPYTTIWDGDCDDTDPDVNPLGTEVICNGIDEDCSEATPDDWNADGDPVSFCEGDCDDTDPANYPGNQEVCDDGIDNDCDGSVDTDDFDCPCPRLTDISCIYPRNGAIVSETPVFTWDTNAGTDCHSFAVDLSFSPAFSGYWSTYKYLHGPIRGDSWAMPQHLWYMVPTGSTVYWRVRGADIDHGPFTVTTSAEVRRFQKW